VEEAASTPRGQLPPEQEQREASEGA
jgi:hypothetical protein